MKVLVTGGSGFIGSHLVERLRADGVQVRCLLRDPSRPGWLKSVQQDKASPDLEIVTGDCTRPETLGPAVAGVDRVYHSAGVNWAADSTDYFLQNAGGTRNLVQACVEFAPNLSRFVYISSLAASGPARKTEAVLDGDPLRPMSPYGASKAAAEFHVLAARRDLPVTVLRPAAVYGPRDRGFLQYFRLVKRGFLVEFGPVRRRVSICHVADLVDAIVAAGNSQSGSGAVYFVASPEPCYWSEVEAILSQALGVNARRLRIPQWILRVTGEIAQRYAGITGKPVELSAARAAELAEPNWVCGVTKLQHELGITPSTHLEQGLRQAVRWYQQQKWL